MRYRTAPQREAGFTATEVLVSIAIGGVLLAAITTSFISQSRSYDAQEKVNAMQQTARAVMDLMTREIRMAGYNPEEAIFNGVETCSATSVRVKADLDSSKSITASSDEDITYTYVSAVREIQRNGQTVAEDIVSLDFDCIDKDENDAIITLNPVRKIRIDITARTYGVDPSYSPNSGYRQYTLTTVVTPRNLTD